MFLTTGRVVSQFLSGTQTRRIGPLVNQYPEPRIEMHPRLAAQLGIADKDWTTVETRRGTITLRAMVVTTIRPDTIFIPYHWAGKKSAEPGDGGGAGSDQQDSAIQGVRLPCAQGRRRRLITTPAGAATDEAGSSPLLRRPEPLHRLPGLRAGVQRVRHASRRVDDSPRVRQTAPSSVQTVPVVCMHCEQPTCAEVCPADAIKRTADGVVQSARKPRCIACGNCVVACPFGVPEVYEDRKLMMKCDMCYDRTSIGKKPMCATVCPSQALFYGTRGGDCETAPAVRADQPVSVRRPDHHHSGVRDDAAAAWSGLAPLVDVTAALDEHAPSRPLTLKMTTPADRVRGSGDLRWQPQFRIATPSACRLMVGRSMRTAGVAAGLSRSTGRRTSMSSGATS